MTASQLSQLAELVRMHGFRISNLNAKRAGIPESVLAAAERTGRAKIERAHFCGTSPEGAVAIVYLVFA